MLCHKKGGYIGIIVGIWVALFVANKSHAEMFDDLSVRIEIAQAQPELRGAPIIFIPGLNSSASVFDDLCQTLNTTHSCYLIQLPGFAGLAPSANNDTDFLVAMQHKIEHYLQERKIHRAILVGHSLGGTLSLMIAQHQPELSEKLIIIDALPFYSAIQNPAATVELMRPQAEQMRVMINNQTDENYFNNARQNLNGMSRNSARTPQLIEWLKSSDRTTTTAAIVSMMVTDLRQSISAISAPTLVLGSWAGYQAYGATKETTKSIFRAQYANLHGVDIRMSDTGFHFLMWDDANWVKKQVANFLK